MARLAADIRRFLGDESGQATTEYVLIVGLISIPIWWAFNVVVRKFLDSFIGALIGTFTRG